MTSSQQTIELGKFQNTKIYWQQLCLDLQLVKGGLVQIRVAKCHVYEGYIRVRILAGWGKKFWRTFNFAQSSLFWEDLHN